MTEQEVDQIFKEFFEEFKRVPESIPSEFQKVIDNDLWDLYE